MARSRLEKIGTIYSRSNALLTSGALTWEERPLWFDIYERFPPKDEPRFDRPVPNMKLKQIFYEEDKLRAMFHKNNKQIGVNNMFSDKKSITQRFIDNYKKLESQYPESNSEQLYQEAIELLKSSKKMDDEMLDKTSLSSMFKEAETKREENVEKINITNIFKE